MRIPKFSIVVPMYNAEVYIKQCLDSILYQEEKDFEAIIVDDGSTDSCGIIADGFEKIDNRFHVIHQQNAGSVKARKVGVESAKGEYVVFLDSDDWIHPDHLSNIRDDIDEAADDIVAYGYIHNDEDEFRACRQALPDGRYNTNDLHEMIIPKMFSVPPFFTFGIYPTLWTTCIKRNLLLECQKNVPEEITIGDDAANVYACILKAKTMRIDSFTTYVYRENSSSMTHRFDSEFGVKIGRLIKYLDDIFSGEDKEIIINLYNYIYKLLDNCIGNYYVSHNALSIRNIKFQVEKALDEPLSREAIEYKYKKSSCDLSIKDKVKLWSIKHRLFFIYWIKGKLERY